jgi:hypothetical protein
MKSSEWTPARVKDELPEVRVQMPNGELCMMRVSGRLMQFAQVSDDRGRSIPFAWPTIAHCLNTGRAGEGLISSRRFLLGDAQAGIGSRDSTWAFWRTLRTAVLDC